jgi:hypothetical protein
MTIQNYSNGFEKYIVQYAIKEIRLPQDLSLLIDGVSMKFEKRLNLAICSSKSTLIDPLIH